MDHANSLHPALDLCVAASPRQAQCDGYGVAIDTCKFPGKKSSRTPTLRYLDHVRVHDEKVRRSRISSTMKPDFHAQCFTLDLVSFCSNMTI